MKTGLQSLPQNTRSRSEVQGPSGNSWTNHEPRNLAAYKAIPRPDWLPESVWPFETFGLPVDGSRLAVTDVGRGAAQYCCLCILDCGHSSGGT